jgi:hypothetical protein
VPPTGSVGLSGDSLSSVTVTGLLQGDTNAFADVSIGAGGFAQITNATVAHDVDANGRDIYLFCGFMGGNVTIGNEPPGQFSDLEGQANCFSGLTVNGSVNVSNSPSGPGLVNSKVGGSVTVTSTGTGGGVNDITILAFNQISGSLQLSGSGPAGNYSAAISSTTADLPGQCPRSDRRLVGRRWWLLPERRLRKAHRRDVRGSRVLTQRRLGPKRAT